MGTVRRRRVRWSRVLALLVLLLLFGTCFAGAGLYLYTRIFPDSMATAKLLPNTSMTSRDKHMNVLLLGVDDGDEENPGGPRRSDTIMLAGVDNDGNTINLLSIPRDTRVNIPGYKGADKINHAFFYGEAPLAVKTVEDFLNVPVDHYLVVDWQAFIRIVDILGGVDIYVEHDMAYDDPYADLHIKLSRGYQHLNGQQAGQYVRFRHDELGDIGRVQRQQRFVKALTTELMTAGTIVKIPEIINTLRKNVSTDMNVYDMIKLAFSARFYRPVPLNAEMLPGNFATINGYSYWEPDRESTKQVVNRFFKPTAGQLSGVFNNGSHKE